MARPKRKAAAAPQNIPSQPKESPNEHESPNVGESSNVDELLNADEFPDANQSPDGNQSPTANVDTPIEATVTDHSFFLGDLPCGLQQYLYEHFPLNVMKRLREAGPDAEGDVERDVVARVVEEVGIHEWAFLIEPEWREGMWPCCGSPEILNYSGHDHANRADHLHAISLLRRVVDPGSGTLVYTRGKGVNTVLANQPHAESAGSEPFCKRLLEETLNEEVYKMMFEIEADDLPFRRLNIKTPLCPLNPILAKDLLTPAWKRTYDAAAPQYVWRRIEDVKAPRKKRKRADPWTVKPKKKAKA
ncbi:hypothetical protein M011DRAFT_473587 [Sporormia fimetaria CBS 119925]|uniref:Uncharacterized protein n=1 Tax=Sporormia fimetaria CBS 119925 TaxID=1340428 RepID=A0A6A6VMM8_9PLEO|nr:hypothetical protein M011DRAFT_473587 [Sporormia fimetaria CBS 119925]